MRLFIFSKLHWKVFHIPFGSYRNLSKMMIPKVLLVSFPHKDWSVTCISVTEYSPLFMWDTWVIFINTWIRYSSDTLMSFRWFCRSSDFVNRTTFSSSEWCHNMSKWSREYLYTYFPRIVTVLYQIVLSERVLSSWHMNFCCTWEDVLTRMDVTNWNKKTRWRPSNLYISAVKLDLKRNVQSVASIPYTHWWTRNDWLIEEHVIQVSVLDFVLQSLWHCIPCDMFHGSILRYFLNCRFLWICIISSRITRHWKRQVHVEMDKVIKQNHTCHLSAQEFTDIGNNGISQRISQTKRVLFKLSRDVCV